VNDTKVHFSSRLLAKKGEDRQCFVVCAPFSVVGALERLSF
jgi:hypothetical protein